MYEIQLVDTEQWLLELKEEWKELVCRCPDVPYFLTWEYVRTTWEHFANDRQPWVLTARDQEGELVGIAPWTIRFVSLGPLRILRLEFLSRAEHPIRLAPHDGEDLDLIVHPQYRGAVTESLLEYIDRCRAQFDVADFGLLSSESRLRAHLNETRVLMQEQTAPCAFVCLPEHWSSYEESVLGKKRAKQLRYQARLLERHYPGRVEYRRVCRWADVRPALENLIELNLRRWHSVGVSTLFEDKRVVQFHMDFAEAAFERDWWRFYELRVDDQVIAATCGVVLHGKHYGFRTGFDPDWKRYGPGNVIQYYEIKKAVEEGVREYDPQHGYIDSKRVWTDREREDVRVIVSNSWKGVLYLGTESGISAAKSLSKRLLSEETYEQLRRRFLKLMRR